MAVTFEEYQAQYESSFLPYPIHQGLSKIQTGLHHVVCTIDKVLPTSTLITKIIQLSVGLLSLVPTIKPLLDIPQQFCKDAKNWTSFFKGFKSVEGMFNLKFSWRVITLNVSGMTLFVLSIITLVERFQLLNVTVIKVTLAAIPIFGALPFGGLLSIALIGLASMLWLLALDKKRKLEQKANVIQETKVAFWSSPLDLSKIQVQQAKYEIKIEQLKTEKGVVENLLQEGVQVEENLNEQGNRQRYKLKACQKAIRELTITLENQKVRLEKYQTKNIQWVLLQQQWDQIDLQEVEDFRQAKEAKWTAKIEKIELEKRGQMLSMAKSIMGISKQLLTIATVVSGYGIALAAVVNFGLEIAGTGCAITKCFNNRAIQEIKSPSIDLDHYVHLEDPLFPFEDDLIESAIKSVG